MTPADIRLSIVIATTSRPSLLTCLASIAPQAREGDETLVVLDAPLHGGWGYVAHNRGLDAARGTHVIFLGDDDDFLPGAFDLVRAAAATAPGCVHLFRVLTAPGQAIPRRIPENPLDFSSELIPQGGIVTPLWTDRPRPRWKSVNSADRDFAAQAAQNSRLAPVWHPEPIGRWRTHQWPGWVPLTAQPTYTVHDQVRP